MGSSRARQLRQNRTAAERAIWERLRRKQLNGARFRQQVASGPYIVDFVAVNARLVIEVDGSQHDENQKFDAKRTHYLESLGFRVLRFWNNECLMQTEAVLDRIAYVLQETAQ